MRRWCRPLTAVLLVVASLGCSGESDTALADAEPAEAPAPPPALVQLETVRAGSEGATLWVTGALLSRQDARIAAEVAGRLVSVAEVGDRLSAGQTLARVDDEALRIQQRADQAEEKRLEARVGYLQKQLERVQALADQQITARHQLDELQSQRAMAEQELEGARIARLRTTYLLERSTLKAPFAGRLVERLAQPGDYVTVGEEVARLVDTERVEAWARAPLDVASWVQEGDRVVVEGAGQTHEGRVRASVPVGDDRSRMFEVRIQLDDVSWPVGTPLRVALPKAVDGRGSGVDVPRDALILRRRGAHVFVVDADDAARRVPVVAGTGDGPWIRVEGDLSPGQKVVVRGGERLQDGQKVQVLEPDGSS